MDQAILDLLARLRDPGDNPLSADECATLLAGIRARRDEITAAPEGLTDEAVAELKDLAAAKAEVDTALSAIAEAEAARQAEAEAALATLAEGEQADEDDPEADGDADGEGEGDADGEGEGEGDADAPAEPGAEVVAVPAPAAAADPAPVEAIAAAATPPRPTPGQAARRLPAANSPARRPSSEPAPLVASAKARLVAAGGATGAAPGTEITQMRELAEIIVEANRRMGTNNRVLVASMLTEYPEERHLRLNDNARNAEKIEAALDAAMVASGGICAPVAVDYTMPNWATADRPIKAGLPSFQADRGGLTFVRPSGLSTWSDATGVWSETTDATPGTATKPIHVMDCGDTDTVLVDAIPTRLRFGNMQGRYFPEQIAYNTTEALAVAARDAETNLWDKIIAASTIAHAPQYLGATRDLLAYLGLAAVALRDRGRMSDGQRCRVIIHRLFKDMVRSDLAREIGHNQSNEFNALAVTDQMIDDWFDARGITPIWSLDSPTPATIHSVAIVDQGFADQSAGAVLSDWPASCAFTIFPEGGYQFLDGGRLDLGIVRDSTLDSTNDYETFIESFESVAFRSVEATTVVVPIVPNGASAGTVAPAEPAE